MQINGKDIQHVYCVGVGGVGVGPVAGCLRQMGLVVSGADVYENALTEQLQAMGVQVFHQHQAQQLGDADALVYSSAVDADNPEWCLARERGIVILQRAEMLAHLLHMRKGIAVAGTHGKTTTTAMVAHLLMALDGDSSYVVGGCNRRTMNCTEGANEKMWEEVFKLMKTRHLTAKRVKSHVKTDEEWEQVRDDCGIVCHERAC